MAEAHFPSKEEVELLLLANDGATVLVTNPNYISIKRELFIYGLQQSSNIFLDIIRSLNFKREYFPVQETPFIITGGSAVSFLTGGQLETPDLDIELSPFDLRAARRNNDKRLVCQVNKGTIVIDPLFKDYVEFLFEQISALLSEGLPVYEQITLEDTKKDPEIRQGLSTGRIVGNIYVGLIFNPSYYSKIVVVAKLGAFVERIFELKFPKTVFGPPDPEFVLSSGLPCQAPEKMIKLNIVSMNDKLRKMRNAMREYNEYFKQEEGEDGKENGYWLNQESQKRDAIITYKVRIVSHVRRINVLTHGGFIIEMVNPENRDLFMKIPMKLTPYVTPMERDEVLRAVEAQEVEARAAAAAAEESRWEMPKQKKSAKGRTSPAEISVKAPSGFAALADDDTETISPLPVDTKAVTVPLTVPVSSKSKAKTVPKVEPLPIVTKPVTKRPSKMILFIEKASIDNSSTFDNLDRVLKQNTFILEANLRQRRREDIGERRPIPKKFTKVMDNNSLNGAEEIIFQIIPSAFRLYETEEGELSTYLRFYIDRLEGISWDIDNKEIRDRYKTKFDMWKKTGYKETYMSRELLKITFRYIFDWSYSILNDIFFQLNEYTSDSLPKPYEKKELSNEFNNILMYIDTIPICPCQLDDNHMNKLKEVTKAVYARMKARNLLITLDEQYPSFVEANGTDSIPILFFSYQQLVFKDVINTIFSFFKSAGIQPHAEMYERTVEFLNITDTQTKDEENLMARLSTYFIGKNDERALHVEIFMELSHHLWSKFTDKHIELKNTLCRFLLYLFDTEFINLNSVNLLNEIIFQDLAEINDDSGFLDILMPIDEDIKTKELQRKDQMLKVIEIDLMKKIEDQRKLDKVRAEKLREKQNAEAKAAGNAFLAEIEAEAAAKKSKGKKKKGGFKTRKNRRFQ